MARIIYKDGFPGINRLECIEGIEIDLFNGQKALIYPKYAICALLEDGKEKKWDARSMSEIEALKQTSSATATSELEKLDSPAAKHVHRFTSDKHGAFSLPTLLAAMEIYDQREDIDELAKTIEDASLLLGFTCNIWSSCRCSAHSDWYFNGGFGFANGSYFFISNFAVPTILYY